jgi:GNAT superfamily N-acetyltransferase
MPTVTVERTYLRLEEPPEAPSVATLPPGARIAEVSPCPVSLYRRLYAEVGELYHWRDRLHWSDERLDRHLASPSVRVWVLRDEEGDGGYFELVRYDDRSDSVSGDASLEGSVEIAYFGLIASRHGRGLGRATLERAIAEARSWGASTVWLHTCTLDGPRALPNYLARGFVPFKRETYDATVER